MALVALSIELCGALALIKVEWSDFLTPTVLLVLCFVMGSGMALKGGRLGNPLCEQVAPGTLLAAVVFNANSYNIARSFRASICGIGVATAGVAAAFALTAVRTAPLEACRRAVAAAARTTESAPLSKAYAI
ncbi:hypothetical protein ABIE89_000418 [Bradyrhizobium niftali]|uniref:MFS transporter n=1 Tax=Bradyrhizobium niftali TaxID=2560055 RepID=UPI003832C2D9